MSLNNLSIVISAPSGAGKSTIISGLLKEDSRFSFSISTTSRPRRGKERDGIDYNFVTNKLFEKMIKRDEFVEWALVHQNYYGTTKKEIDRIVLAGKIPIFDVDIQGTKILKKNLPDGVFIFIVPPSLDELEKRLRNRKTDPEEQIRIRLRNAQKEFKAYKLYDYLVINDDVKKAIRDVRAIVTSELCRKKRQQVIIHKILEEKYDHTLR